MALRRHPRPSATTVRSRSAATKGRSRSRRSRDGRANMRSNRRPGLLGLKVKEKWLTHMQQGAPNHGLARPKCVEIRGYHYRTKRFLPKGVSLPKKGDRFFLLASGRIWGSARLGAVKRYTTGKAFDKDQRKHHVTPSTAAGDGQLSYKSVKAELRRRGALYGWQLSDFRWHDKLRRPKAGATYKGDRGACRVPDFMGMDKGQVWYHRGTLPAGLEAPK
eukprot:TRINITY_DN25836_c2_g2_i1.p1 TRINITY_DN25836_c2_g2~~TRINITY_DN25836_c2_g2_i1.p1  ORF type:complete len:237 (+),score=16.30 TRINITY_DN25836_c2_g2_i1:55-711(+)